MKFIFPRRDNQPPIPLFCRSKSLQSKVVKRVQNTENNNPFIPPQNNCESSKGVETQFPLFFFPQQLDGMLSLNEPKEEEIDVARNKWVVVWWDWIHNGFKCWYDVTITPEKGEVRLSASAQIIKDMEKLGRFSRDRMVQTYPQICPIFAKAVSRLYF